VLVAMIPMFFSGQRGAPAFQTLQFSRIQLHHATIEFELLNHPAGHGSIAVAAEADEAGCFLFLQLNQAFKNSALLADFVHVLFVVHRVDVEDIDIAGLKPLQAQIKLAHEIALQIAASAPRYIREDEIPQEILERERSDARQPRCDGGQP
jgi:hypothetical protein